MFYILNCAGAFTWAHKVGHCILTADRAHRDPVNAFSREFWLSYGELFDKISSDILNGEQDIRAIVVSSAFPRTFTAGIDSTSQSS